ncbi:MAG: response regulator [Myxococcales bacterium]|nr:response regulator [Myxococcales bacterium]
MIRILCIDATDDLQLQLQSQLGHVVAWCSSGQEGLRRCVEIGYDVVVVDYRLEDGSGVDVMRQLAELEPPPRSLMLTAHGSEAIAVAAMKAGASDYIVRDAAGAFVDVLVSAIATSSGDSDSGRRAPAREEDVRGEQAARRERQRHQRFLKNLRTIDDAIHASTDLDEMMAAVLQTSLDVFDCDRAYLLHPCDPDGDFWGVPMERVRPAYPGAFALGERLPMGEEIGAVFREALQFDDVITQDHREASPVQAIAQQFSIKSEIRRAIHAHTGAPWIFGLHQCSHYRQWTEEDKNLFREVSHRVSDALSSLLFMRELRQSEARFRSVLDSSRDAIYQFDVVQGTYDYMSPAIEVLTGYSPEAFLEGGLAFVLSLLHPDDVERIQSHVAEIIEQRLEPENMNRVSYRLKHRTLGYRWLSDSRMVVCDDAGEAVSIIGSSRDITERKRAEQQRQAFERQMQQAQKLESLGVLAGGIAHDFNNLLTAILGNTELALFQLSDDAPVREHLHEVQRASNQAADLAQQMLTYSGRGRLTTAPVNLTDLVHELTHLLKVSISKKARLVCDFDAQLPAFEGDATQIRQVVMNLIINASEALEGAVGTIELTTGTQAVNSATFAKVPAAMLFGAEAPLDAGDYVFLSVKDSGVGMSQETVSQVFDPFFTTKFTGRGLGMSAVMGIVRGHGGVIRVQSAVGEGTTFTVLLPAGATRALSHAEERPTGGQLPWRGAGTALLVDDVEEIRLVGQHMLEQLGFDVLTAADGAEGLEVFRKHAKEITCVVLDLTMPRMGGEDALREMRSTHPSVAVVLCSGYSEQMTTEQVVPGAPIEFLQKPFDMKTLTTALQRILP